MNKQIKSLDECIAVPHACMPDTVQYKIELPNHHTLSVLLTGTDRYECAVLDKGRNFIPPSKLGLGAGDSFDSIMMFEYKEEVEQLLFHLQNFL